MRSFRSTDDGQPAKEAGHSRRAALKQAAALFGGVSATSMLPNVASAHEAQTVRPLKPDADQVTARGGLAVVETDSGKVAGYVRNGIFTFKGIPYADSPEGVNRFMPPRKPK